MTQDTNPSPAFFRGLFPLRRIIALGLTLAAILAGVTAINGSGSPASLPTADTYTILDRNDHLMIIRDGDGDHWECVGEASADTCVPADRLPGGPAEPLGYRTAEAANEACTNGAVKSLWRRGQVVGYTCLIDWQASLR